ncbi:MAG: hypothetical protein WCG26_04270 [Chloroflexales bacterium]
MKPIRPSARPPTPDPPPQSEAAPRFSLGVIPDFSTTPLYAAAVLGTCDDPRLLALWCHYAFWQRVDDAFREWPTTATWIERTGLSAEEIAVLSVTLMARGLLADDGRLPRWTLQEASWSAVLPYSNELRRRAGLDTLGPVQATLFTEEAEGGEQRG